MVVKNKLEILWKQFWPSYQLLSIHLAEVNEENYEKPQ